MPPDHASLRAELERLLTDVRRYLDLDDGEEPFVLCALAAAVSKALTGEDPLWLFLIGPPGGGKTEAIRLLDKLVDQRVDELTRAGLLSRDKKGRRVGLLTRVPDFAFVTISDFSTVATMGDREARARMYGMLRVVYDGHVYRSIGGDVAADGDELEWSGHLTVVAGATPAIDAHTSIEAALGERWLTVRLPESSTERARRRARFVVGRDEVPPYREDAQTRTRDLVIRARTRIPRQLAAEHVERLVDAATLVATARTGVPFEGQGRGRVIVGIPVPEEPTRLVGQLARLARCAAALGLTADEAVALATRAALDSIPLARMRALTAVAESGDDGTTVSGVLRGLGRGSRWTAIWELDALEAIGLVEATGPSRDEDPSATRLFTLAADWQEVYTSVASSLTALSTREDYGGKTLRSCTPPAAEEDWSSEPGPPSTNGSRNGNGHLNLGTATLDDLAAAAARGELT